MPFVDVSIWTAVVAGLISFFSPCVLPMIPVYLGYMTGSVATANEARHRRVALSHAAAFVAGFSLAFVVLGMAAGTAGRLLYPVLPQIMRVAGVILAIFGLQMIGVLKIKLLAFDRHSAWGQAKQGLWRSLLMGLAFAIGWSPCVGPVLAAILFLAADTQTMAMGAMLLGGYALGLGLPFLMVGLLVGQLRPVLARMGRVLAVSAKIGGALVLLVGLLMAAGRVDYLTKGLGLL